MRTLIITLLLLGLSRPHIIGAEETLVFNIEGTNDSQSVYKFCHDLLEAISAEAGFQTELKALPLKRSLLMIKDNTVHAEIARIADFHKLAPDMIKVDESIATTSLYAYSHRTDITISGIESLRPYSIATISGSVHANTLLKGFNLTHASNIKNADMFLRAKRVDVLVTNDFHAATLIENNSNSIVKIHRIEPALSTVPAHTYFNKNLPEQAQRYLMALKKIKANGVYDKILRKYAPKPQAPAITHTTEP